ncbi:NAD(P)H-hydrate dehydratase [Tianweitania populi]|uniref:Bifunctional NAD(P)H-hydrate repair enzyme n=1 Tax=Tianweitania populi TaxID=1607949 RepID=A0A8J3GIW3_9HYPH|nr:NAD(P)H-hydrate dehydratase [Tianweitania populi]GHD09585.1 bifunctional NAD(P)H-hydrate repair enzyme [Tianweitania populi]
MEILTPAEMAQADRNADRAGVATWQLMQAAGEAVTSEALKRFPGAARIAVLCGPGNNGGDGYVAAACLLAVSGLPVEVWRSGEPRADSDAAKAAGQWVGAVGELEEFSPQPDMLVIDALYGAGLARELEGNDRRALERVRAAGSQVLAVDLPSGLSGLSGAVLGYALQADCTVTFFRPKPGHLLYPGRSLCGELVVADIGIPAGVLSDIGSRLWGNAPELWLHALPRPSALAHKYQRGHVAVLSGKMSATGAARLSAEAAARAGAGAVTVLSPPDALAALATHLTATMLHRFDTPDDVLTFVEQRKVQSLVCGPGFGTGEKQMAVISALLQQVETPLVLDADAITLLAKERETFLKARTGEKPTLVLTPHEGEFARLFPDLAEGETLSKVERARTAAKRAMAVVIYKGADTVIAAPDGRAVINTNGTVWLATAGSGDVLAGLVAALLAQGMPPFEAACAAVWVHAEAGRREGFGMTAEDLPQAARKVLAKLINR